MTAFNKTTTAYKIRRKSDGLYSGGGRWPYFSNTGKLWTTKSGLTNHLNNIFDDNGAYDDCEVVEIEIVEKDLGAQSVREYLIDVAMKREKANAEKEMRRKAAEKKKRYETYKHLKYEFEGDCD